MTLPNVESYWIHSTTESNANRIAPYSSLLRFHQIFGTQSKCRVDVSILMDIDGEKINDDDDD